MSISNVMASVAVKDINSAIQWYERIFGRPPSRPMSELAEWKFERGGWLQVYQLPERAGCGSFTLAVTSIEEEAVRLAGFDIDVGNRTACDKVKTLMITDPDGNHIAFAEALDPTLAQ